MRKFIKIVLFIFFILLVVAGIGAYLGYRWYQDAIFTAPLSSAEPVATIELKEGEGLFDIAKQLETSGQIKSELALRIYLRLNPLIRVELEKGKYKIPSNFTVPEVIDLLNEGPVKESISVRVREGNRLDEVASKLAQAYAPFPEAAFKLDDFNDIINNPDKYTFAEPVATYLKTVKPAGKTLEGFLFPDTYTLGIDAPTKAIVELFINTQIRRLTDAGIDYKTNKGQLNSFYDNLIMASIVEREAKSDERPIIADIFVRRFKRGEILGADATSLYPVKNWSHVLTAAELRDTTNPYNTRARAGLPPTPICAPSLSALQAAFNPQPNQYVYFLHGKDGNTYFARTLSEHSANIRKYL